MEVVQAMLRFPSRLSGHWSDKMPVVIRKENCQLFNFKSASAPINDAPAPAIYGPSADDGSFD